jgi:CRISPR type I-D-associated protein Csc1
MTIQERTGAQTGNCPSVYKCQLVAHDYLFFSSRGFRDTIVSDYIENYALMYAINRNVPQIQRNASGTVPFYNQDMEKVRIYTTPAFALTKSKVPIAKNNLIDWENQSPAYITFNSVNTVTQSTENSRLNLPQIGRKSKFPPLNSFQFFAIGANPSGLIRLGKKQVPCRVFAEPLDVKGLFSKTFQPSHPINMADLKELHPSAIKSGQLIKQNTALLVNARLEADHYICIDSINTYNVLKPDACKYPNVAFA